MNKVTSVETLLIFRVNCGAANSIRRGIYSVEVDVDFRAKSTSFITRILAKQGLENPRLLQKPLWVESPEFCASV